MSNSTPNRPNGSPPTSEGLAQYVHDFVRKPPRLLIDGQWVEAASGKTFETLNPATEELGDLIEQHADELTKDADMALAIPGAANGIFFNQGQCCNGGSRLYIERDVYDQVVQGISDEPEKIRVGPGLDPATQMGPLTSAEQHDKVLAHLSSGLDAGARAPTGGGRAGDRGYFVQPTVLTDTTPDMKVVRVRRRNAVRRLQEIGLGPGNGPQRPR